MTVGWDEGWEKVRMCKSECGAPLHEFFSGEGSDRKRIKQAKPD